VSSDKPFTPSEREAWLASMKEIYRQFVSKSAQGRKMPFDKLEKLAQGRIYTGNMAVANGLVDRLGTLHDAVAEAKKAAGVKDGEKVELLILPRPKSVLEQLFGDPEASMESAMKLTGLADPLLEINLLRRLFAEPALTLMPYRVELK
jgi:protease-4